MTDMDADDTSFREFTKNLFESWFIFEALHDFRVFFRIFCGNTCREKSCHRRMRKALWLGFCLFHKAEKWEAHVDRYKDLASNDHGNGVTRLDFMASALKVLDSKFSSLLQFNGLLLAASALAVQLIVQRPSFRLPVLSFGLFWLSLLGGLGLWIWTFYLCMRGQAEVLWGDMWEVADPAVAERREVRQMIGATIMRTARMRMAVVMTMVVGILLGIATLAYARLHFAEPSSTPAEEGVTFGTDRSFEGFRVTFPSGISCANNDLTDRLEMVNATAQARVDFQTVLASIVSSKPASLRLVASADTQPLGARLKRQYGNNVGLALSRGYCTASWLQSTLAQHGLYLDTHVTLRTPRRNDAAANDRTVEIQFVQ